MNLEQLGPVDHGTVVVVREPLDPDEPDEVLLERRGELVAEIVRVCGHTDFVVLFLDPDTGLDLADEDTMNAAGWWRTPEAGLVDADEGGR